MILKKGGKANGKQAVRALNLLLGLGNYETFTSNTKKAVKDAQIVLGLTVDGVAGPQTLAAIANTLPDVKYGDETGSNYVKAVQALVSCSIDGKYGNKTRSNVIAFQTTAGLEATGDIRKNDWLALWDCPYVRASKVTVTPTPVTKPVVSSGFVKPVDYKQGDSRWKSKPYTSTGKKSQTIGSSGCGPTSMSDIQATWVDRKITPVEMCSYALKHGFRTAASGTAWGFFKSIAKAYGYSGFVQTKSMATAREALRNGAYVVASMGPGYWTKGGHYICLWRTDDSYMYANDPASSVRKKQKLKAFEQQRKQFFIFYRPR